MKRLAFILALIAAPAHAQSFTKPATQIAPCATTSALVTTAAAPVTISTCARLTFVKNPGPAYMTVSTPSLPTPQSILPKTGRAITLGASDTSVTMQTASGTQTATIEQCAVTAGSNSYCKW